MEILEATGKSKLDAAALREVCPLMLYQLQSGVCQGVTLDTSGRPEIVSMNDDVNKNKKPTATEGLFQVLFIVFVCPLVIKLYCCFISVWGYGVLFVTLISLCSLVGVSVLPLMGKAFYAKLLTVLIGLAVGSLTGSSVFHLIPQAFGLMKDDPHHSYLHTSALVWSGIWLFFMIERFLKIIMDWKEKQRMDSPSGQQQQQQQQQRGHSHMAASSSNAMPLIAESPSQLIVSAASVPSTDVERIYESQEQVIKASFGHQAVRISIFFEYLFDSRVNFVFVCFLI